MRDRRKKLNCIQNVTMDYRYSLLTLFLFLCLVYPCGGNTDPKTVAVFKDNKTDVFDKQDDKPVTKGKPISFGPPAFVGGVFNGKEFLAIMSDASYATSSDKTLLEPVARTSNGNYKEWSDATPIFNSTVNTQNKHKKLGKVTVVMNKNKIFVLATSFDASSTFDIASDPNIPSESFMIVGTLVNSQTQSSNGSVTIEWDKLTSLKGLLKITDNVQGPSYIVGGIGNGVVMKNNTIVLPVQIQHEKKRYNSASIIYSTDDGVTWHMGAKTISGTSQGSVVEFCEEKLLFSVQSSKGFRAVYETQNMGATWRLSQTFTEVWGNEKTRSFPLTQGSVITVPVAEKKVLLFSQTVNTNEIPTYDTLQLWVSDGQRISCVGTINEKKKEHIGNSVLTFANNKLYITYEITSDAEKQSSADNTGLQKVISVTPLDDYFELAKKTVLAWRALDKKIAESSDIFVDGLVGFLGNTTSHDGVWPDKYNCVNATVKGATLVKGGFFFSGAENSGAQWPVANQGQNQLYKFTRKQFTLAATVKLHSTGGEKGVTILGADISTEGENTNFIGIGCSNGSKWYILHDNDKKHLTKLSCELEKEYHIAITFSYGVVYFYVNGSFISRLIRKPHHTLEIKQFFLGSTGTHSTTDGNLCTVKNVLLFNWRLEQRKIFELFRVSKNRNLDEPLKAEQTTLLVVSQQLPQATQPETTTVIDNSAKNGDPKDVPVLHNSVQTTKTAIKPANDKTLLTKTSEQTSVTVTHKISNASETDKHLDLALDSQQSATLKKHLKPTDSSTVSFAFFQFMCVVCTFILLAQV